MRNFNAKYFYAAVVLFLIEALIALFLDDRIIRPLIGDGLVVILIYCMIKAFWPLRPSTAALFVFAVACLVEALQFLNLADRLGLRDNPLFAIIMGTTFDGRDILAYGIGTVLVLIIERQRLNRHRQPQR